LILAAFIPLTVEKNIEFYNSVTVTSLGIIVYVIRTIVLLVVAVCFFWHLLSNTKRIFEKGYKFIWWFFGFSDPLYFRIEMLLFFFMWILIHPAFGLKMKVDYYQNHAFTIDLNSSFLVRAQLAAEILS
jgi:hypothetical protein